MLRFIGWVFIVSRAFNTIRINEWRVKDNLQDWKKSGFCTILMKLLESYVDNNLRKIQVAAAFCRLVQQCISHYAIV